MTRIAVLIATFNRAETTLLCLRSLFASELPEGVELRVFLVDGSSPDGTAERVRHDFPHVNVFEVRNDSYWAQSMRHAWERAQEGQPEYILWLNDDVRLYSDALRGMVLVSSAYGHRAIVAGATSDSEGRVTYSGYKIGPWYRRLHYVRLEPKFEVQECDAVNGNVVLIPSPVDVTVGGFPTGYVHGMADFAYTLKARRLGVTCVLAPGTAGTCSGNDIAGSWRDRRLGRSARLRLVMSAKGLPVLPWLRFCLSFGGVMWLAYFLKPYLEVFWQRKEAKGEDVT